MKKVLISLGYREMNSNVWGKPFGHHLLLFELDKLRWTNWFKGNIDVNAIWNSKVYVAGDIPEVDKAAIEHFKEFIIELEAYTNVQGHIYKDFSFISVGEILDLIL